MGKKYNHLKNQKNNVYQDIYKNQEFLIYQHQINQYKINMQYHYHKSSIQIYKLHNFINWEEVNNIFMGINNCQLQFLNNYDHYLLHKLNNHQNHKWHIHHYTLRNHPNHYHSNHLDTYNFMQLFLPHFQFIQHKISMHFMNKQYIYCYSQYMVNNHLKQVHYYNNLMDRHNLHYHYFF